MSRVDINSFRSKKKKKNLEGYNHLRYTFFRISVTQAPVLTE